MMFYSKSIPTRTLWSATCFLSTDATYLGPRPMRCVFVGPLSPSQLDTRTYHHCGKGRGEERRGRFDAVCTLHQVATWHGSIKGICSSDSNLQMCILGLRKKRATRGFFFSRMNKTWGLWKRPFPSPPSPPSPRDRPEQTRVSCRLAHLGKNRQPHSMSGMLIWVLMRKYQEGNSRHFLN